MNAGSGSVVRTKVTTLAGLEQTPPLTDTAVDEMQRRQDLRLECRLLYVAYTRARNHLWVGWSGKPSRFLGPILGD